MPTPSPIGIMAAMPEEIDALLEAIEQTTVSEHGRRQFHLGSIAGVPVVCVHSRCGKVAAATTTAELIVRFGVDRLVFTGMAGALDPALRIGDIVVATALIQHDLDASPIFPPLEVPLLGQSWFPADEALSKRVAAAAARFIESDLAAAIDPDERAALHIQTPTVHRAPIASGDVFVGSDPTRRAVTTRVPEAVCVEMEGAAAAQVAFEYGIPLAVVRTISDAADDHAGTHFPMALGHLAGAYSKGILHALLEAETGTPDASRIR